MLDNVQFDWVVKRFPESEEQQNESQNEEPQRHQQLQALEYEQRGCPTTVAVAEVSHFRIGPSGEVSCSDLEVSIVKPGAVVVVLEVTGPNTTNAVNNSRSPSPWKSVILPQRCEVPVIISVEGVEEIQHEEESRSNSKYIEPSHASSGR